MCASVYKVKGKSIELPVRGVFAREWRKNLQAAAVTEPYKISKMLHARAARRKSLKSVSSCFFFLIQTLLVARFGVSTKFWLGFTRHFIVVYRILVLFFSF